jgi:hypothetical protein
VAKISSRNGKSKEQRTDGPQQRRHRSIEHAVEHVRPEVPLIPGGGEVSEFERLNNAVRVGEELSIALERGIEEEPQGEEIDEHDYGDG